MSGPGLDDWPQTGGQRGTGSGGGKRSRGAEPAGSGLVRPYAVDVASGVEQSPGRKARDKMLRFIGNAREAAVKFEER